jgi:hypothetical protein
MLATVAFLFSGVAFSQTDQKSPEKEKKECCKKGDKKCCDKKDEKSCKKTDEKKS